MCVTRDEAAQIFRQCHSGPSGGHYGMATTARKVFEAEFYWPDISCDPRKLVRACDACQLVENISVRDETPQKYIQIPADHRIRELRLDAYEASISYKERMKRWHDKRIKTTIKYKKGDKVLLVNSRIRLFPGKLKSRWYGPFTVSKDMKNRAIELFDEDGNEFIVNKQRVKAYQTNALDFDGYDDVTLEDEGGIPADQRIRELRLDAYEASISYKERMKRWHDKRIKTTIKCKKGDKVIFDEKKPRSS
nr:hypothetical protein [Tanacetum cinerariifolium]